MNRAPAYRGQPLVALLLILGGWVTVRVMIWDAAMVGQSVPTVERSFAASRPGRPCLRRLPRLRPVL